MMTPPLDSTAPVAPPTDTSTLPILYGVLTEPVKSYPGDYYLRVWCDECGREHVHGWNIEHKEPRHKSPHCDSDSAYRPAGYLVAPFPAKYQRSVEHVVDPVTGIPRKQRQRRVFR